MLLGQTGEFPLSAHIAGSTREQGSCPVLIRLLGSFGVLKNGQPVAVRSGGRTEALLSSLALRYGRRVPREVLLGEVWPDVSPVFSGQSLNSLVHSLHRLLGDALLGAQPVVCSQGAYYLNADAGVAVDVAWFDALASAGDQHAREQMTAAMPSYLDAIRLYGGDLCSGGDQQSIIERERLRARYLTLLARAASHFYAQQDIDACLGYALRLLDHDPAREDAHRLVMRCHVARGERAQALRQFRVCEKILLNEFDAAPEPDTLVLYEQIRLNQPTFA